MKTAIIYYSFEGNCAQVAEVIRTVIGGDLFEIKTLDTKKREGFAKYAWGGFQVLAHKWPALQPLAIDINAYDLIILGTPVWAASPAPAMLSFLEKTKIAGKKLALFCCHAGGKGRTLEKFKTLLGGNDIAGEIDFLNPAAGDPAALKEKISGWLKNSGLSG